MTKKKIVVVVADGRVESLFFSKDLPEDLEVEIVDFDEDIDIMMQDYKAGYVDLCREKMTEVIC